MTERLRVRGSRAWVGPGQLVEAPAVVLDGARIAYAGPAVSAPPAEREITGAWFLMPGAVDHHVHIRLSDPKAVLNGGVTLARDLAWPADDIFPLADISQATEFAGPVIEAAGPMITAPAGYPTRAPWAPQGTGVEVRGAEEAAAAVERIAAQDPAVIKVALNADAGPTLTDSELVAVCGAAHGRGLKVTAHAQGTGQAERAAGGGVDELAHCPWTERLSDDLIHGLARSVTMVSTLDIHSFGRRTKELEVAIDNLSRFVAAGGTVRYGTDLGNGPIPPGIHLGEVVHLAAAGLGPDDVLASLARGPLKPGAAADMVGLAADPFDDLSALGRVELVIRAGRVRRQGR